MARTGRPPKAAKVDFTCKQCGKIWQQYAWQTNDRANYCSRECFYASRVGKPKISLVTPEERECARCGQVFLVGGTGNKKKDAKYCSRTCAKHGYWGEALHKPARLMSESESIWLAAVIDGEGSICWPRRTVLQSVRLVVANTNTAFLNKIMEVTGTGRIRRQHEKSVNPNHSKAFTWDCYGDNARKILLQVLPWLIIKKQAAETVFRMNGETEPPWTQRTRTIRGANESDSIETG